MGLMELHAYGSKRFVKKCGMYYYQRWHYSKYNFKVTEVYGTAFYCKDLYLALHEVNKK